jgi:threonine dehydrogenase-like Zn-dependent dehydrogenase
MNENRRHESLAVFPAERRIGVVDHPEPNLASATQVKLRMLDVGICGTNKEIACFTPPPGSST